MKVKELYIKDYHQFEDFGLDLTYPEGHEKAGQPLDKVCFIGQSGTGKTSLLEVINSFVEDSLQSVLNSVSNKIVEEKNGSHIFFQHMGNTMKGVYDEGRVGVFSSVYDLHKRNNRVSVIESFRRYSIPTTLCFDVNFSNIESELNSEISNHDVLSFFKINSNQ
jgi:recombinational DNA repair ATPase RecF